MNALQKCSASSLIPDVVNTLRLRIGSFSGSSTVGEHEKIPGILDETSNISESDAPFTTSTPRSQVPSNEIASFKWKRFLGLNRLARAFYVVDVFRSDSFMLRLMSDRCLL